MGRDWRDRTAGGVALALDVAKGAAGVFPPLKATLEAISTVYSQYKVYSLSSDGNILLNDPLSGNCLRQE